ncbi:hypothetical protein FJZ53_03665 [Candidatus Woesearchaeota archaeon]|nr:hypothetical protein [Candidatus Woesearchaeota archaeon]
MNKAKYHIQKVADNGCIIGSCPEIYELVKSDCLYGACPAIFEDIKNDDIYLIVGKQIKPEEFEGLAEKIGAGETAVAVPKSLIDKLYEKKPDAERPKS